MMVETSTERNQPVPEQRSPKQRETRRKMKLKTVLYGQLLVWATRLASVVLRLELHGLEHVHESIRQGRPIIFAGWHGHNFLTILSYYREVQKLCKGTIIVPDSEHGRVMEYYGCRMNLHVTKVNAALGPSQWARATITMIKQMKKGYSALLSPDGPDGPAYEVKPGIVYIGQQTKAVIIPASAAASRSIKLRKRWDEHLVPIPGSRAVVYFGAPIETTLDDGQVVNAELLQETIKQSLNEGIVHAERLCRGQAKRRDGVSRS